MDEHAAFNQGSSMLESLLANSGSCCKRGKPKSLGSSAGLRAYEAQDDIRTAVKKGLAVNWESNESEEV
ncbi:hypothetical protein E2P81_ATG04127 [Venturia nashicola]|nr:hypothetical protein E2P81_ATG04127 [Venturia nashicola]